MGDAQPPTRRRRIPIAASNPSAAVNATATPRFPLTTESAMKKIEDNNTLVFIVETRANKSQIKAAVRKLYEIQVRSAAGRISTGAWQRRASLRRRLSSAWHAEVSAGACGLLAWSLLRLPATGCSPEPKGWDFGHARLAAHCHTRWQSHGKTATP